MLNKSEVFFGLLSEEQFDTILENQKNSQLIHPVLYLLDDESIDSSRYNGFSRENTRMAIALLQNKQTKWLNSSMKKLTDKDMNNVSATLGEIRCFGCLAEVFGCENVANIEVKKDCPTPDFMVKYSDEKVMVEVNTVQMNAEERKSLDDFYNSSFNNPGKKVSIGEHVSHPYGDKKGVSFYQSVILKVMSIKESNHQLNEGIPSILWVDLQDSYMNSLGDRGLKSGPFFSGISNGGFEGIYSNELWYSLYGKKDDYIFRGETLNNQACRKVDLEKLVHSGKFFDELKYKNLSAVVYSAPNALVLFENPNAQYKLSHEFMAMLTSSRWFRIEASRMNFPNNSLEEEIEEDRKRIMNLSNENFYSF